MKIVSQYHEIIPFHSYDSLLYVVEIMGRICYQSGKKITYWERARAEDFVEKLIKNGHESVIEHAIASVIFVTDRGVSHELVRHRLASYSQESTRYCRYDDGVVFIKPVWYDNMSLDEKDNFSKILKSCEDEYLRMLEKGVSPQKARQVLPNALKTQIGVTANIREWRHIFKLRTSKKAHPQMSNLMYNLFLDMRRLYPAFFNDLEIEYVVD